MLTTQILIYMKIYNTFQNILNILMKIFLKKVRETFLSERVYQMVKIPTRSASYRHNFGQINLISCSSVAVWSHNLILTWLIS